MGLEFFQMDIIVVHQATCHIDWRLPESRPPHLFAAGGSGPLRPQPDDVCHVQGARQLVVVLLLQCCSAPSMFTRCSFIS